MSELGLKDLHGLIFVFWILTLQVASRLASPSVRNDSRRINIQSAKSLNYNEIKRICKRINKLDNNNTKRVIPQETIDYIKTIIAKKNS